MIIMRIAVFSHQHELLKIVGSVDCEENAMNVFLVRMGRRGVITLPKQLRDRNSIKEGDTLTLIELSDGVIVMCPRQSRINQIADKLASGWQESGESLESMLTTLRAVRAKFDDKYP